MTNPPIPTTYTDSSTGLAGLPPLPGTNIVNQLPAVQTLSTILGVDPSKDIMTGLAASANGITLAQQQTAQQASPLGQVQSGVNSAFLSSVIPFLQSYATGIMFVIVGVLLVGLSLWAIFNKAGTAVSNVQSYVSK